MRASQRYAIVSSWRVVDKKTLWVGGTSENHAVFLVHESADIRDTQGGWEYTNGVHRVYAKQGLSGKSVKRVKTFYGETAWSNATRLYDDYYFEFARA